MRTVSCSYEWISFNIPPTTRWNRDGTIVILRCGVSCKVREFCTISQISLLWIHRNSHVISLSDTTPLAVCTFSRWAINRNSHIDSYSDIDLHIFALEFIQIIQRKSIIHDQKYHKNIFEQTVNPDPSAPNQGLHCLPCHLHLLETLLQSKTIWTVSFLWQLCLLFENENIILKGYLFSFSNFFKKNYGIHSVYLVKRIHWIFAQRSSIVSFYVYSSKFFSTR